MGSCLHMGPVGEPEEWGGGVRFLGLLKEKENAQFLFL